MLIYLLLKHRTLIFAC